MCSNWRIPVHDELERLENIFNVCTEMIRESKVKMKYMSLVFGNRNGQLSLLIFSVKITARKLGQILIVSSCRQRGITSETFSVRKKKSLVVRSIHGTQLSTYVMSTKPCLKNKTKKR